MSTRESLQRYTIIINRLRQSPASFSEIAENWSLNQNSMATISILQNEHFSAIWKRLRPSTGS